MSQEIPFINARAEMEFGKISVTLFDRVWTLHRPGDLESLWDAIVESEFSIDERLPYWVELWPASLALASHIFSQKENIAGRRCLDLGCGLGFTTLVATWLGARVIGMDYELQALHYAVENTSTNNVPETFFTVMDWRTPALKPGSVERIWGGDIMYEDRFGVPIRSFLDYALVSGGIAWLAEPGRRVFDEFQQSLVRQGWRSKVTARHKVKALHDQPSPVPVNIWEIRKP